MLQEYKYASLNFKFISKRNSTFKIKEHWMHFLIHSYTDNILGQNRYFKLNLSINIVSWYKELIKR